MKGQGGSSVLLKVNFHPPYSLYGCLFSFCMRFPGVGYRNGISARHPKAAHAYMSPAPSHDTYPFCLQAWGREERDGDRFPVEHKEGQRGSAPVDAQAARRAILGIFHARHGRQAFVRRSVVQCNAQCSPTADCPTARVMGPGGQ